MKTVTIRFNAGTEELDQLMISMGAHTAARAVKSAAVGWVAVKAEMERLRVVVRDLEAVIRHLEK